MVRVVADNLSWMAWNTVLAIVPLVLAIVLFGSSRPRSRWWWVGAATFVAFLPNAPYVLTDVIHLGPDLGRTPTMLGDAVVTGSYVGLFVVGFGAYAASLGLLRRYLRADGKASWRWPAELCLHGLCAVGIFLGRVMRFNSWDVVLRPHHLIEYVRVPEPSTLQVLLFTYLVLLGGLSALRLVRSGIRAPRTPLG